MQSTRAATSARLGPEASRTVGWSTAAAVTSSATNQDHLGTPTPYPVGGTISGVDRGSAGWAKVTAAGILGSMNATFEHPSLRMNVTDEQRDRAEHWLQEAYADGRITELEFDQRIGQVISAVTRKDLNEAFYGLVHVPTPSTALGVHPAYQPLVRPETKQQVGRGAAALAHFSVFFGWLLGPGLVYAVSAPGSYARKEAAKAFNFTLISTVAIMAVGIIASITDLGILNMVLGAMWVGWFLLTIVGGAKALQGDDWQNPVTKAVPFKLLDEKK